MFWRSRSEFRKVCDDLCSAIEKEGLGAIYAAHQRLIFTYYDDVQEHAKNSFNIAAALAITGFLILVGTLVCMGWMQRYEPTARQ